MVREAMPEPLPGSRRRCRKGQCRAPDSRILPRLRAPHPASPICRPRHSRRRCRDRAPSVTWAKAERCSRDRTRPSLCGAFQAPALACVSRTRWRSRSAIDLGRPVQPLFDRDHLPAGEALFAPSVPAQPDQFRRSLHRAHHGIELLQPVGMAVHKHRQIAPGEGRLVAA